MAIEILEIHHTGVRIDAGANKLSDTETFYKDVLGLARDEANISRQLASLLHALNDDDAFELSDRALAELARIDDRHTQSRALTPRPRILRSHPHIFTSSRARGFTASRLHAYT